MPLPEPWLRGPMDGVHPLLAPPLHALQQAREDLDSHTAGLDADQIWSRPCGLTPLGFHLRHIAGSLDRLTTYLEGRDLTEAQFAFLNSEMMPGADRQELLLEINRAIDRASAVIQSLSIAQLESPRSVGRRQLPTTAIGLAVHLAEHTQRHVGQAIVLAQLIRSLGSAIQFGDAK